MRESVKKEAAIKKEKAAAARKEKNAAAKKKEDAATQLPKLRNYHNRNGKMQPNKVAKAT